MRLLRSLTFYIWMYGLMVVFGLIGTPLLLGPRFNGLERRAQMHKKGKKKDGGEGKSLRWTFESLKAPG